MKLVPDKALFKVLIVFLVSGTLLALLRMFSDLPTTLLGNLWWFALAATVLFALCDAVLARMNVQLKCSRQLPGNLALSASSLISLSFENHSKRIARFNFTDSYPDSISTDNLPGSLELQPGQTAIVKYRVRPTKRGVADFGKIQLRLQSPFNLWRLQIETGENQSTKVYPNFMALANLDFLDYEQQLSHIGAHLSQRRGSGQEFKQLREYQRGDEIRSIDWKATSRQHKLISREYQDERDQEIIFMLDSGRRMRAMDDELSHFDHSINAMLLTSYIALSAGDAVGFMSFAGENRWVKPVKGKAAINTLLNHLYDLHSSPDASDLTHAAETMMFRHQKRSLVVIITNLRDEDADDLLIATQLLSRKHLVMVACLKERCLKEKTETIPENLEESLSYAATALYTEQRQKLIKNLQNRGIIVADSTPEQMHVTLVNQYMVLKRAGRI